MPFISHSNSSQKYHIGSIEDQDYLFDLSLKRRTEKRRLEIKENGEETLKALAMGTATRGTAEDIKAYLLENGEE